MQAFKLIFMVFRFMPDALTIPLHCGILDQKIFKLDHQCDGLRTSP